MSNKEKINNLREELNNSIAENRDYSIIYDISVKLDKLIAEYYEIGRSTTTELDNILSKNAVI